MVKLGFILWRIGLHRLAINAWAYALSRDPYFAFPVEASQKEGK